MKKRIAWTLFGLAAVGLAAQPLRPVVVSGGSMSPTYRNGEWLLTEPVDRPLRRGDVVIADTPVGTVVKRVALVAGDRRVQFRNLAGSWYDMTTLSGPLSREGRRRVRAFPLLPGTVFLLGDNIGTSVDSRSYGPVPLSNVRRLVIDPREPDPRAGVATGLARLWIGRGTRVAA